MTLWMTGVYDLLTKLNSINDLFRLTVPRISALFSHVCPNKSIKEACSLSCRSCYTKINLLLFTKLCKTSLLYICLYLAALGSWIDHYSIIADFLAKQVSCHVLLKLRTPANLISACIPNRRKLTKDWQRRRWIMGFLFSNNIFWAVNYGETWKNTK